MSWDDSDSDWFDGFSWGILFSDFPWWAIILLFIIIGLILYYT